MLSTSVQLFERFLVQENGVAMLIEDFLQNFHCNQVVVDCFACIFVDSAELKLIVSDFIVLSFKGRSRRWCVLRA